MRQLAHLLLAACRATKSRVEVLLSFKQADIHMSRFAIMFGPSHQYSKLVKTITCPLDGLPTKVVRPCKKYIYDVSRVKFWKVGVIAKEGWVRPLIPKEGWAQPLAPIFLLVWQRQRPWGLFSRNARHCHVETLPGCHTTITVLAQTECKSYWNRVFNFCTAPINLSIIKRWNFTGDYTSINSQTFCLTF